VEFLALLLATETNGRKPIMAVVRGRQEVGPRALGRARHGGDEREDEQIEVPETWLLRFHVECGHKPVGKELRSFKALIDSLQLRSSIDAQILHF